MLADTPFSQIVQAKVRVRIYQYQLDVPCRRLGDSRPWVSKTASMV